MNTATLPPVLRYSSEHESSDDTTRPARVVLQHRAPTNIRRQWLRDSVRISVLVCSDFLTLLALRVGLERLSEGIAGFGGVSLSVLTSKVAVESWQFTVAAILSLVIAGTYGVGDKRRDARRILSAVALAGLFVSYSAAWQEPSLRILVEYGVTVAVAGVVLLASRQLVDVGVRWARPLIGGVPTLVVARGDEELERASKVVRRVGEFTVVATVRLSNETEQPQGVERELRNLGSVIEQTRAQTVLLWGRFEAAELEIAVDLALAAGCRLVAEPWAVNPVGVEPRIVRLDGMLLHEFRAPNLHAWQLFLKRVVDILASTLGLAVLAPLFAVIGVLIKLESPGRVFFRQKRMGRAGKVFRIYKFRSMIADAEQRLEGLRDASIYRDDRLFKVPEDPRVTRLGNWLRRSSLDELPQLINVLRGDMSLVGPRPPLLSEVALYEEHHFCRFDVKPGITGPWQVSGRNTITDFEEVIRLESDYIRTWSIFEDLHILFRTIPVVFYGGGAH